MPTAFPPPLPLWRSHCQKVAEGLCFWPNPFLFFSEDELMEVGNLIVSSRFRPDGHGVVNLTWEVPTHLQGKIRGERVEMTL